MPPTSGNACATWTGGSPGPAGVKLTSVLHELPPPRTGRCGRPRTHGAGLGTPTDLAASATAAGRWRTTRVRRYGRTDTVQIRAYRHRADPGVPTPCRSLRSPACGTDHFAAEPSASFWSATTSPELATATTADTGSPW